MAMEAGLDTGPMVMRRELRIGGENSAQVTEKLAEIGATMMVETLAGLDVLVPVPQPEDGVTYAAKIAKQEARIDWSRPAAELLRHVQGLAPFPGAWFEHEGERIKLLSAELAEGRGAPGDVIDGRLTIACGDRALRPVLVQRAGRGSVQVDELLRGFAIPAGTRIA